MQNELKNVGRDSVGIEYMNRDLQSLSVELKQIDAVESIRIEISEGLESALSELEGLQDKLSANEGEKLIDLCRTTVHETIVSQFGLASLFIECKDGGNVTTSHNFDKGIVANEADQKKLDAFIQNNDGSKKWSDVRKDGGYDKPLPGKRKDAFKTQDIIVDEYTGRPLPKDGRSHLDHIVSAKEIESKAAAHLHMTPEQRAEMATNDKNLAWTEGSANQSKGENGMQDWLQKTDKKIGQTKGERFEIDEKRAMDKDKAARKYIKKEMTVAAVKKYSKEVMVTGGKDAARMAAYTALGAVMQEFSHGIFIELKATFSNRGREPFHEMYERFKHRMAESIANLKEKWGDILKHSIAGGLTAFFSNLLVFVINLFATTLKKFVQMIRAGFVSLVQAVKIMAKPPVGMSQDEANFQAVKIMTAGVIGAASLGLGAAIEKFLQSIPGLQPLMMFPIPSFGGEQRTVSDVLAVTLSALLGGIMTTVTIYFLDKMRNDQEKSRLQIQLLTQSGVVVEYKVSQSWMTLRDAYLLLQNQVEQVTSTLSFAGAEIEESYQTAVECGDSYSQAVDRFKACRKNI